MIEKTTHKNSLIKDINDAKKRFIAAQNEIATFMKSTQNQH